MMSADPQNFLRCSADGFTAVRDGRGRLLGCIPRLTTDVPAVVVPGHQPFETRVAAVLCVCVGPGQDPSVLPGFVCLDTKNADLANSPLFEVEAEEAS